ncbi:MAG: diguanylate cyclase [Lachnospiraceae bacterium]|nr:diguanylate cyclase [Lachnospiraceae bacterium]
MREKISLNKTNLQLIAVVAMLVDHLAWTFVDFWSPLGQIMHIIGRLTIPIMCFFIAEGFKKTHSIRKYIGRLAVFAIVSIVPFYLFFNNEYEYRQNIIFDYLLSILILTVLEHKMMKKWMKVVLVVFLFAVSAILGGWPLAPECFTLAFYYGKTFKEKAKRFAFLAVLTFLVAAILAELNLVFGLTEYDWTWYDRAYLLGFVLAIPLLSRYNGEKGKPLLGKYFFYFFYPVHLLLLSGVRQLVGGGVSAYDIYVWIHVVCLLIVFTMLIGVLQVRPSTMQTAVVMFLLLESFYIVGFIMEILATTLETFNMACVIEYFGELLMLVAFLIVASECGHIKIPLFVYIAHVLVAFVLVYSIATNQQTGFFYSDIELVARDGHMRAYYTHATGYYFSVIYITLVIAEMFFIMVNSFIRGAEIEKRRVLMLFAAVSFTWIPYAITMTGITGGYEVPVIGVVGAAIFLTLCFYRYGTFDSVAIVSESALTKAEEGVIIIDDRRTVTFSNIIAKKLVGDDSFVDSEIEDNETIRNILEGSMREVEYDGKIYEIRVEEIKHNSYIQGHTIWFLDATRHKAMLDEAEKMANHDALTGLYNRRHFERLVSAETEDMRQGTLVLSDMDNFKSVNDKAGHKQGDIVLVNYAKILSGYSEEILYPCRIGGDEFMFYLRNITDLDEVEKILNRIMDDFKNKFKKGDVRCTLSMGVVINNNTRKIKNFSTMYKEADDKLYKAKGDGKNKYVI